jgi:hypothetical protein
MKFLQKETGKIYHPELRNKCLEHLKEILESKNLLSKAPNIQRILDRNLKKNNNDIIFLLDISESMTENKEDYALREILKFFDKYMEPNDRAAFIRFNHNCNVIFTLTERGKNHVYLRNSIQNSKETVKCEGETAFFSALYEALEMFKKAGKFYFFKIFNYFIINLFKRKKRPSKMGHRLNRRSG